MRKISWTDGTPTESSTNNQTGVNIPGPGKGFSFTAAARNDTDTLNIYVSGNGAGGTLTAHLSNYFAPDFERTVATTRTGKWDGIFTLVYDAKQNGKTLDIKWVQATEKGSIGLQAASISGKSGITSTELLSSGKSSAIQVYPNPARNFVTIEFGKPVTNTNQIELFDLLGNAVYKSSVSKVTKHEINTEKFSKGIYILKIVNGNEKFNTKLILE